MRGGACFERYIYASPRGSRTPWYTVVPLDTLLHRAPLAPPLYETDTAMKAWKRASNSKDVKMRGRKGYFLYNQWIGYH